MIIYPTFGSNILQFLNLYSVKYSVSSWRAKLYGNKWTELTDRNLIPQSLFAIKINSLYFWSLVSRTYS